jgi:3-oxoacyl-[acyl-carrier protein] reductase
VRRAARGRQRGGSAGLAPETAGGSHERPVRDHRRRLAPGAGRQPHGTFYVVRSAVPLLRRNGPDGGAIVNIASVGALANYPLPAAYPASKAGVLGLTRAVAALLGPDNIRVNAVAPGAIDTPMLPQEPQLRSAVVSLGVLNRVASPDELAASIAFLASDEGAFYTGQTLSPNGGYVM